jgi:hypothetical protein
MMFRSSAFSVATAVLIATVVDCRNAVSQEYRITVSDLERRFDELVKLNDRLAETLERREQTIQRLAARVEALEAANRELIQQADSIRDLRAQVRSVGNRSSDNQQTILVIEKAIMKLQGQIAEIESRLSRLESRQQPEPRAEEDQSDQAEAHRIPSSCDYPSRYESRGPRRFSFRGRIYANFEAFKRSPDFALYQEENRQAAERFAAHLQEKERRYEAAGDVLRHRREHMVNQLAYKEK